MTKINRFGISALVALMLVGEWTSCGQSDKAGILLTIDQDPAVSSSPAITSLAVTVSGITKTFDVSSGLPGTLGIKTSPGDKNVAAVGLAADRTPVANGQATCQAQAGKVIPCTIMLYPFSLDAGIPADAGSSDISSVPGLGGTMGGGGSIGAGGASGGVGGTIATGGTAAGTSAGGVSGTGGVANTGGRSGVFDAGSGDAVLDARPNDDLPPSTTGGAGGVSSASTAGGRTGSGGKIGTGGVTGSGGISSSGGGAGTASTGGLASTGGTSNTGGATGTGGTTKLLANAVAAGYGHSCALIRDGTVWCWGNDSDGELGDEDPTINGTATVIETKPVQAKIAGQALSVATGKYHTCVVLTGGTVQCFGYNATGQLGNGQSGYNVRSIIPVIVRNADQSPLSGVSSIVAGTGHTCALLADKTVKCWGDNTLGQLGNGNNNVSVSPVSVLTATSPSSTLTNVTALTMTHDHACAIRSGGSVYCWGDNSYGQLGNGVADPTAVAVGAKNITASAIGAGGSHSCAVATATVAPFNVQCWGDDSYGELGDQGSSTGYTPVHAKVLANASAIALGGGHSCAVMVDSTVECWGYNQYGQLGNGGSTSDSNVPVVTSLLQQATSASAGENHTCALLSGGAVYCWGDNWFGQTGNGQGGPNLISAVPVLVSGF